VVDHQGWIDQIDPASIGCVVACSDSGEIEALRDWNRLCVDRNMHFFPVVLQNLIGSVGPFVVPGETACYECIYARQNSHLEDPVSQRAAIALATKGQSSTGFHVTMASLVGDIAACELFKFYSDTVPERNVGRLIQVDLLDTRLNPRKVLKIPRCIVCSPLNARSSMTPYKLSRSTEGLADT
jgi:thiazole/oxazole-forming peptide maturase SagC family component